MDSNIRKTNVRGGNPTDTLAIELMIHLAENKEYTYEILKEATEKLKPIEE